MNRRPKWTAILAVSRVMNRRTRLSAAVDSRLHADVAASLDGLAREREAIDRVLAGLHDPGRFVEERGSDATQARQSTGTESLIAANEHRASSDSAYNLPPVSDGGMVLLQSTGDANSSAYDLAAVILNGASVESSAAIAAGPEAAIGVYQAFDVSGAESRPAETVETPRGNAMANGQSSSVKSETGA